MLHLYSQYYFKPVTSRSRRSFKSPTDRQRQGRRQCALLEYVQTRQRALSLWVTKRLWHAENRSGETNIPLLLFSLCSRFHCISSLFSVWIGVGTVNKYTSWVWIAPEANGRWESMCLYVETLQWEQFGYQWGDGIPAAGRVFSRVSGKILSFAKWFRSNWTVASLLFISCAAGKASPQQSPSNMWQTWKHDNI